MTHRLLQITAYALTAFGILFCGVASAQEQAQPEPPKSEAQVRAATLFSEGRGLAKAGNYKEACPKFEQSLRLNVGVGVQFNLADCWEHVGRTASAQSLFQGAAATARAAGQTDRAEVAQARADALNPRLIRMVLDVKATDPALLLRRNQVAVDQQLWGTATPVDAGEYLIEASAPGKTTWSTRIIIPAATTDVVSITVPPLVAATEVSTPPAAVAPLEKPTEKARPITAPPPLDPGVAQDNRRRNYALSFAGLGVVSVGLGTVFGLEFRSKNNDAKAICPSNIGCSISDVDNHGQLVSDAKKFRTLSFVGFGVGAASLITAGVLFLSPSKSEHASFSALPFVAADGSWGAAASGRF